MKVVESREVLREDDQRHSRSRKEAYRGSNYLEIDINQHTSSYVKKKAVFGLKESLVDMVLDIGFLIESQEDDEMPENLIGTIRLQGRCFSNLRHTLVGNDSRENLMEERR
mmetsp:Transcript_16222/g.22768  ORF Transcript_16222/g.22768 Transcript_16222/m.22768 type:complete len:111 (+) Transcript_16222:1310-1642(+)